MISFAAKELQGLGNPHEVSAEISGLDELWAETLGDPVGQSHPSLTAADPSRVETLVSGTAGQGLGSRHRTHIINISAGELTPSSEAHPILDDAAQACAEHKILIVAAVGNDD